MPLRRRGLSVPDRGALSPRVPARASGHRSPPHAKRRAQESRWWPQTARRARAKRGEVPCVPPPKSQHALGATGQAGDGDTSTALSLLPTTGRRGQNPALPRTVPQFPPKHEAMAPLPPARKQNLPRASFSRETKCPPTKKPHPKATGVGRGIRHRPPSTRGSHVPPRVDCPDPGGIRPKAEVAGGRNDMRDPKPPSLGEGGPDRAPEEFTQDGTN